MNLDDEICLCFHISKRKLVNYLRIEKVARASQLSECGGAGTGCGWCRSYLEKLFAQSKAAGNDPAEDPASSEYALQRVAYIRAGHGTPPPGATPVDEVSRL